MFKYHTLSFVVGVFNLVTRLISRLNSARLNLQSGMWGFVYIT
ncbi:hypothetical protein HanPSC8_Chr02g0063911 [Helianthus annuus]|nr:hypothetical protein HanPSC8_Chr02g0063911 [Helianthus annuus]